MAATHKADREYTRYQSVATPNMFREIRIANIERPTVREERAMSRLADLAERYGTSIVTTSYRRG